MAQPQVKIVAVDNQDYTITALIADRRFEFFIKPDVFRSVVYHSGAYVENEWFNKAATILLTRSVRIIVDGVNYAPDQIRLNSKGMTPMSQNRLPKPTTDHANHPSTDYPYTLIVPEAQNGLVYQGTRIWHKTEDDAVEYAKYIYNANKDAQFSLVVVKACQEIAPKPQIELTSKSFSAS